MKKVFIALLILLLPLPTRSQALQDYSFNGSISRSVLERYLDCSITMTGLASSPTQADDLRMIKHIGAKFVGRAAFLWGQPPADEERTWQNNRAVADQLHQDDSQRIVQAAIFEAVFDGVSRIPIPSWVFEEFQMSVEKRNFRYEAMLFPNEKYHNHWMQGASVPDIMQRETQLWYYYLARRYIDSGYEALHWGQICLTGERDNGFHCWNDLLTRVRRYAALHARRRYVLFDAHFKVLERSPVMNGRLLLDFLSYPMRPVEIAGQAEQARLQVGHADTLYGRVPGGIHPSGWKCTAIPYLVEFDQCNASGREGQAGVGIPFVWGYEEAAWFAHQPEDYRNKWLRYARTWLRDNDPDGHLEMPGRIPLAVAIGDRWYHANRKSDGSPYGGNQEDTMRALWSAK